MTQRSDNGVNNNIFSLCSSVLMPHKDMNKTTVIETTIIRIIVFLFMYINLYY